MRSKTLAILAFSLLACGNSSSGSSLVGAGFSPNGTIAGVGQLPDGGLDPTVSVIEIANTNPTASSCELVDAGFPDGGLFYGAVILLLADLNGPLAPGTVAFGSGAPDSGVLASVLLSSPTIPVSGQGLDQNQAISGSITLTHVGTEFTGSFTAVLDDSDGGQSPLSGTFDTSVVCPIAE